MSVEDAEQLYELIGEDESLQSEFEGLESKDEVIDKALEVAEGQGIDVSRSDLRTLFEQLAEEAEQLDDEELEDVAGGSSVRVGGMEPADSPVPGWLDSSSC